MAQSFVGIDIGNQNIKIASLRRVGGRFVVEAVASERLGNLAKRRGNEFNVQGCSAIIGRLLQTHRIKPSACVLGLAGKEVIFRFVEVPPVGDAQIRKLLEFEQAEAAKGIEQETVTDYQILDLPRDTPSRLALVGTARAADLDEDARLMEAAKAKLRGIVPKSLALHRLAADTHTVSEGETVLLLDIGAESTDVAIMMGSNLVLARTLNIGGKNFTDAVAQAFGVIPEVAEEIKLAEGMIIVEGRRPSRMSEFREGFDELVASEGIRFRNDPRYPANLSRALSQAADQLRLACDSAIRFAMVQTKVKNIKLDRIILSGGGAKLPGLLEFFQSSFRVPVEYWDVFSVFDSANVPPDKRDVPTEFATALALAYLASRNVEGVINLLPATLRERRRFLQADIYAYLASAVVVLAAVLMWFGVSSRAGSIADARKKMIKTERIASEREAELARLADSVSLETRRLNVLASYSWFNPLVMRFLAPLPKAVPETVKLLEVRFEAVSQSGVTGPKAGTNPDYRFVVRGYVDKDVPELQQAQILKLFAGRVDALPFVERYEMGDVRRVTKSRRSRKNPVAPETGSYQFTLYFYVSKDGRLSPDKIAAQPAEKGAVKP